DSDLANAALTRARPRGNADTARATLAAALGEDDWHAWKLVPPPMEEGPAAALPDETRLIDEALERRSEPRELELRARGFRDTARSARGGYLPALSLQLGPTFAGTDITSLTTNFTVTLSIGYSALGMNPLLVHGQTREA